MKQKIDFAYFLVMTIAAVSTIVSFLFGLKHGVF